LNHWKYLSGFFSWCVAVGYVAKAPAIYNPDQESDEEDGVGKSYTDEELLAFQQGSAYHKPMHLWIMIAQYMGMRSSEISQLMKDRIDLKAGLIKLRKSDTKTATQRSIPIHPGVLPLIVEQMAAHPMSPALFPNAGDPMRPMDKGGFKKPWTKLRQDLGINGRFHDFRASYATRAFSNADLNPVLICTALGMSMRVAMRHYIRFDEKQLNSITSAFKIGEGG
jgi:integrase